MRTTACLTVWLALGLAACAGPIRDGGSGVKPSAGALGALARDAAHPRVVLALEQQLFSTPDEILRLCATPIDFSHERMPSSLRDYLTNMRLDPTMAPTVSCLFVATGDGSTTLYTYARVPEHDYYVLREQRWIDPGGAVAVAKHPFHLTSYTRPEWSLPRENLDRVVLSPLASLPFNQDTELTLRVTEMDGSEHAERIWVDKTFEIRRDNTPVERLHLVVRDYGTEQDGPRLRRWYLYSERANTIVRQAPHPISLDPEARRFGVRMAQTDIHGLAYIKDGRYAFVVSSAELRPLRIYLGAFDIWNSR